MGSWNTWSGPGRWHDRAIRSIRRMKVLVLGGEGMLGHKMFQILSSRYPETTCTIAGPLDHPFYRRIDLFAEGKVIDQIDAMNLSSLNQKLPEIAPPFI